MIPNLMTDLLIYLQYLGKMAVGAKKLVTSGKGVTILIPVASYTITTDIKNSLAFLLVVFSIDFITGIYASFVENIAKRKLAGTLKTGFLNKVHLFFDTFTSEKWRTSIVKGIGYLLFILLIWAVERIFLIKSFTLFNISDKNWTITLAAQAFCIAIEIYSIIFENIKRAGYDITDRFIRMIKKVKEIKNEIKEI